MGDGDIGEWQRKERNRRRGVNWQGGWGCGVSRRLGGRAGKTISDYVLLAREMHKVSSKFRQKG